jgi:hypothetical protein
MDQQNTPRQPELNKKKKFNRCFLEVRGLPLEHFHLNDDGRKWQQKARARKNCLCMLANRANPDGSFVRGDDNYSPTIEKLKKEERISERTFLRHCESLRKLGLLTWTRLQNHYGRRIYTIHLPAEKHLPDSIENHLPDSGADPRTWQVITPATEAGDSGKTPATEAGDNTCHIRGQNQQNNAVKPTVQYSPPSFDDLPSSKNSKTGGVSGGLSLNHHHRLNTDLPSEADDDEREKIPPRSQSLPTSRVGKLKAAALANFQAKHRGKYSEVDVLSILEIVEARIQESGTEVSSARYFEKALENEFKKLEKSDPLFSQEHKPDHIAPEPQTTKAAKLSKAEKRKLYFERMVSLFTSQLAPSKSLPLDAARAIVLTFVNEKGLFDSWEGCRELFGMLRCQCFPNTPEAREDGKTVWLPETAVEIIDLLEFGSARGGWSAMREAYMYLIGMGKFSSQEKRRRFEDRLARFHIQKETADALEARNAKRRETRRKLYAKRKKANATASHP